MLNFNLSDTSAFIDFISKAFKYNYFSLIFFSIKAS